MKWQTIRRGAIVLTHFQGLAPTEISALLEARVQAHHRLVEILDIDPKAPVFIRLSPSRAVARAQGFGVGEALLGRGRVEVVLLPGNETFEWRRPGHLLAKLVLGRSKERSAHLSLLKRGVPEAIDGPSRAVHWRYLAGGAVLERGGRPNLANPDPLLAGSFLRYLVDLQGWATAGELFRRSGELAGMQGERAKIEQALDRSLRDLFGQGLDATVAGWQSALAGVERPAVAPKDRAAIDALVRRFDRAESIGDAAAYRAGMEAFYCDVRSEVDRKRIARTVVGRQASPTSRLLEILPQGVRNYPEVKLEIARLEGGVLRPVEAWLERFPEGWRMTWSSDWPSERTPLPLAWRMR